MVREWNDHHGGVVVHPSDGSALRDRYAAFVAAGHVYVEHAVRMQHHVPNASADGGSVQQGGRSRLRSSGDVDARLPGRRAAGCERSRSRTRSAT